MQNYSELKAYSGSGNYIFVSYSHMDKELVYPFINALQKEFNVWFDEGIHYGHEWEEEIVTKLEECSIFIFIVSNNSLESENCKDELFQARELGKNFINLILEENTELPKWFKLRYSRFQMCNYFTFASPENVIEDLNRKSTWFDAVISDERLKSDETKLNDIVPEKTDDGNNDVTEKKNTDTPAKAQKASKTQSTPQNDADYYLSLGKFFYFGDKVKKDYIKAFKYFKIAADMGNAEAQYYTGLCYYSGNGTSINFNEAYKYFKKSADSGNTEALYYMGRCLISGKGVKKDIEKGNLLIKKASDKGNAKAQYFAGLCYYSGNGTQTDYKEAVRLFEKAAEQGNSDAMYYLGCCYHLGKGVIKNIPKAIFFFREAANLGNDKARLAYMKLYTYGKGK